MKPHLNNLQITISKRQEMRKRDGHSGVGARRDKLAVMKAIISRKGLS